jgi:hypothetical protein
MSITLSIGSIIWFARASSPHDRGGLRSARKLEAVSPDHQRASLIAM